MISYRELLEQASTLYLENMETCVRHRADVDAIFDISNGSTRELYEWTRLVFSNLEHVCATHSSGILFISLISLSHFTQKSMYTHWKESNSLKNINLFGLVVGLSGKDIFFCFCFVSLNS
jgi:hypothetical protein